MSFTFKVGESIKKAWILYKENFNQIMILALIMLAIQILSQSVSRNSNNLLFTLIIIIISIFLSYLWIKSSLSLIDGKGFNPFAKETLPSFRQIWDFFKTNILVALCIIPIFIIPIFLIGIITAVSISNGVNPIISLRMLILILPIFVLFIIPAIYVSSRLFPAKYLSVEKCQGARKSVSEAWIMTKGNGWIITWKIILIGLFTISGIIVFVVGALVTYPLGIIVMSMMYREISKSQVSPEVVTAPIIPITEAKKVEEIKPEEVKTEEIKEEVK